MDLDLTKLSDQELLNLYKESKDKVDEFNTKQMMTKLIINSVYGAVSKEHFNMFNIDVAGAITSSGRYFIRNLAEILESELQKFQSYNGKYIIYGDTDSVYLTINPIVEKYKDEVLERGKDLVDFVDRFEKKVIQPIIQKAIDDYADTLNILDKTKLGVAREVISESGVFTSKKRYFMKVSDLEGVRFSDSDPYIKVMGLEIVRSSTPTYVRKKLKESIRIILEKDQKDLRDWVRNTEAEFAKQPLSQISQFANVSSIREDFLTAKSIHINAKASGAHNLFLRNSEYKNTVEDLKVGQKYMKCYLRQPNDFKSDCLMFSDPLIEQLIVKENIFDYEKNFNVSFLKPLEGMIESLGYNLKPQTLDLW